MYLHNLVHVNMFSEVMQDYGRLVLVLFLFLFLCFAAWFEPTFSDLTRLISYVHRTTFIFLGVCAINLIMGYLFLYLEELK